MPPRIAISTIRHLGFEKLNIPAALLNAVISQILDAQ
jgi:hypothetical protein